MAMRKELTAGSFLILSALLIASFGLVGHWRARLSMEQRLQHTLVPGSSSYLSASKYLKQVQSAAGQVAYEKKQEAKREAAMREGMKQAKQLYQYTMRHGYGKDQDREMWKTLEAFSHRK
ncbi:hypothetical protein GUITHDRAFT_163355 [Guillardia theta CCMP2712]|uniref:Uncharacterized protein n=1 Tax=Guillardia theta (strain CCMP2712) TaxID=905079 RepID=L1JB06_GUITC|nr:hypothetical protein GUITHDRAFT_163355 [Guillardia theta CCMP2712]EKX45265.1 hypothetical protein GUITHDRAFT_163355 [Guillardia theta CCMP2712]|eukprot:XP_005832245.1 hypothetical protein GUITHDRAFT_163355 [Guillardia theta CCMP2712]